VKWHEESNGTLRVGETRVARRIRLGEDVEAALAALHDDFGRDAEVLALVFAIHRECGGNLAAMVEMVASAIEDRARSLSSGRASGSGVTLSSRLVAGLPLLSVPLLPASRAPLLDPLGLAMLLTGILLAIFGLRWVNRLVPVPAPVDDPAAVVADLLASVVTAGVALRIALDRLAPMVPPEIRDPFRSAYRRVTLGCTWPEALAWSDNTDLRRLGELLQDAQRLGTPVVHGLHSFARDLRTQRDLSFDERMRKAPVLMVLPLVLCILPSFLLLVIGPFIRGLSIG
jgi:Flp pilus assembly protein TadB